MSITPMILTLFLLGTTLARPLLASPGVAKVIIKRNQVKGQIDGKTFEVEKGKWLQEGTVISTSEKSFIKLIFTDKSSINIGPKSEMKITAFPKDSQKAGIVTLLKGQMRSQVNKNYLDPKKKEKSKLFVKTRTAAMGVRGTDFQVVYNKQNRKTGLIIFKGKVVMVKVEEKRQKRANQRQLERWLSSPQAVVVKRGEYAGTSPKESRASTPVRINPNQLEILKQKETPGAIQVDENSSPSNDKKKFKNIIPEGAPAKDFTGETQEAEKEIGSVVGQASLKEVSKEIKTVKDREGESEIPPPEGNFDRATGENAPAAGGYFHLETAQYIPPPPGSVYDPNAKVYVPPSEAGYIDGTGSYRHPDYNLMADGTWVLKEKRELTSGQNRNPASSGASSTPPPPPATYSQTLEEAKRSGGTGERDTEKKRAKREKAGDEVAEQNQNDVKKRQENASRSRKTKVTLEFTVR